MYDIQLSEQAVEDLESFRKYDQVIIYQEMDVQLTSEPDTETKKRKPLRPGHVAEWELRIGDIRVFYDVDQKASLVKVARLGYKKRNRLFFRGEEFSP
jgi:mRNA-degrading endonuclease RelE of RelBE toxin-antitoxin system